MAQDKAQVCLYGSLTNTQKEPAANTLVQHRRFCTRKAESHKALQGSSSTFIKVEKSQSHQLEKMFCIMWRGIFLMW